jgi:hypothetical protein
MSGPVLRPRNFRLSDKGLDYPFHRTATMSNNILKSRSNSLKLMRDAEDGDKANCRVVIEGASVVS